MWAVGLVVGALLGASFNRVETIFLGAVTGLVVGIFTSQWKKGLLQRSSELEARVELLARAQDSKETMAAERAPAVPKVSAAPPATPTQGAIALAALGVAGGFLAPVLTATEKGDHVLLFSYYALLNAEIFGIAWFKAWRSLNLLGFVFTFVIGTLWGASACCSGERSSWVLCCSP